MLLEIVHADGYKLHLIAFIRAILCLCAYACVRARLNQMIFYVSLEIIQLLSEKFSCKMQENGNIWGDR